MAAPATHVTWRRSWRDKETTKEGNGSVAFPHQYGRTRRFTLGVPRQFTVSPDGSRIAFCRTRAGTDPVNCLWVYDVTTGIERLIYDPSQYGTGSDDKRLPNEERIRRERTREQSTGVTQYATDAAVRLAAFALDGQLWLADLLAGASVTLPAANPVVDPRPDPAGQMIAYVMRGALRVIGADGSNDRPLTAPDSAHVTYGLAEHVAAESFGRLRGYWWSPDGRRLIAARVDSGPVQTWYLANPADPTAPARPIRYPAAGTANADVSLWILGLDGSRVEVDWDRRGFEYVTAVLWDAFGLLVVVQNRAQTLMRVLAVEPDTGRTHVVREDHDHAWVTVVPGVPARTDRGELVWTVDRDDTRRLMVQDQLVTPPGLQVRELIDVAGATVLFAASTEPTEVHLWTWSAADGAARVADGPAVHYGRRGGATTVITSNGLDHLKTRVTVRHASGDCVIDNMADTPVIAPGVDLFQAGERRLRVAVLVPSGHAAGSRSLPVLMDPYGGPAAQRVLAASSAYLVPQWFADQGFIVVVADGRGTPGRGPAWERSIHRDKGGVALSDQIVALRAAAERYPDMDLRRVGIRGWSYGGFLAALAVLRRPDIFHAAVAGAPVIDQRLYDTHWQERYLGHPAEYPQIYDEWSLDAEASNLRRPLLLIHGLADDNVHPAHTLRMSAALLAAGRPHAVLPIPSASHMTPADDVTAHLLDVQAHFLRNALATPSDIYGSR